MDESKRLQIEGKFDDLKGRFKEAWGVLTDDDIKKSEGQVDQLIGIIKKRTGETAETIEKKFNELLGKL